VTGDEPVDPAKAALLGPVRVIPLEYGVRCRAVDVLLPADPEGRERLAGELLAEIAGGAEAPAGAAASHVLATGSPVPASGSAPPAGSAVPASGAAIPASGSAVRARETAVPGSGPAEWSGGAQAQPIVALRHGRRWLQRFERVALPAPPRGSASAGRLRPGGVALITGALGGIGAALAQHLFETAAAKLVLLNRTPLPPREEWAEMLAAAAEVDPMRRRVERLLALERLGAEVLVVTADVADGEQLSRAVGQAMSRFGAIHAVIHAAGVPGGGLIQLRSAAQAAAVLSPKVRGTMLLESLLPAHTLDLYVLCSSLASILGGVGQVDYCAANAFLDATAAAAAARGAAAVSIAWDAWRDVGMAAEALPTGSTTSAGAAVPATSAGAAVPATSARSAASAGSSESAGPAGPPGPRRDHRPADQGLSNAEGLMAFERAVAGGLPQVAVSTLDLDRLSAAVRTGRRDLAAAASPGVLAATAAAAALAPASRSARHPRPELATPYAAPRNQTEQALAGIWEEVLGIEPVGIHDDFAELGGHSLLALQVLARVRDGLAADLPLRAVFDAPTVAALSVRLLEREAAASDQGDVEEMLARLEDLSDGEAEALLGAAGIPSGVGSAGTGETR
jgi:NAD(P)-dependent dehydrogenase (short-subunit alcohol dehydrogenase family)